MARYGSGHRLPFHKMTPDLTSGLELVAAAVLIFTALHDLAFRTVPNWTSAALVVLGGLLRVLDDQFGGGLGCGLGVFCVAALCWWRGWLGGGDVKLLGATAVLVPPTLVPAFVMTVALGGGVLALLYLLLERLVPSLRLCLHASFPWRILVVECRRIRRRISLPYATAISAAALLMLTKG